MTAEEQKDDGVHIWKGPGGMTCCGGKGASTSPEGWLDLAEEERCEDCAVVFLKVAQRFLKQEGLSP